MIDFLEDNQKLEIDVEKNYKELIKQMESDGSIEVLRDYIKYLAKK